jgi:hypothetical protein
VAEEGVRLREIAEVVGKGAEVAGAIPADQRGSGALQMVGHFAAGDLRASSAKTRQVLGWEPTGPGLMQDHEKREWV